MAELTQREQAFARATLNPIKFVEYCVQNKLNGPGSIEDVL